MIDHFKEKFIEDATDLINKLENDLLVLEENPDEKSLIEQVFRVMHTLKGVSGMYGFDNIGELTHKLETLYDFVREGTSLTKDMLDITFTAVDHIKNLLESPEEASGKLKENHRILLQKVISLVDKVNKTSETNVTSTIPEIKLENEGVEATYFIKFLPDIDIFKRGVHILSIFDELHSLGNCIFISYTQKIPELKDFELSKCYFYWEIYLATTRNPDDLEEVMMFIMHETELHKVANCNLLHNHEFCEQIETFSRSEDNINSDKIQKFVDNLVKTTGGDKSRGEKVLKILTESKISSIRVASDKLDSLMNLVSELITTQAELSLIAENNNLPRLTAVAENIEKISRKLRENAFSICLVPISEMITRFHRLVRDLSSELGKEVVFLAEGTETELDKTIIDGIGDPLMHILRNSIDHGIEKPDVRIQKGKSPQGIILFKAFYQGTHVIIQVQDDGSGINLKKVRDVAVKKGFLHPEEAVNDKRLLNFIFFPGFTTSENVSEISGRGVGMDVVKRKLSEIRGEIDIDTKIDIGTTITIKLPLTLSIIDALLVKIDTTRFLIPLAVVDFCSEVKHETIVNSSSHRLIINGELIPFIYLREEFSINANHIPKTERVVIVNYENQRIGLIVDAVVGEHQAVLKPLGEVFRKQEVVSGASVLGDGGVALVVDTNKLISEFTQKNIEN